MSWSEREWSEELAREAEKARDRELNRTLDEQRYRREAQERVLREEGLSPVAARKAADKLRRLP